MLGNHRPGNVAMAKPDDREVRENHFDRVLISVRLCNFLEHERRSPVPGAGRKLPEPPALTLEDGLGVSVDPAMHAFEPMLDVALVRPDVPGRGIVRGFALRHQNVRDVREHVQLRIQSFFVALKQEEGLNSYGDFILASNGQEANVKKRVLPKGKGNICACCSYPFRNWKANIAKLK